MSPVLNNKSIVTAEALKSIYVFCMILSLNNDRVIYTVCSASYFMKFEPFTNLLLQLHVEVSRGDIPRAALL